ncbi:hypothetical protein [Nocardioides sp. J54]|uniref:hypothetical protein n=1 Tax=Nocardioides sp. J54 TaxID=935866 RepID=UPI0004B78F89|nr:hypothetical protein [Nocardioides sp. J54]
MSWANTTDRTARTAKARAALEQKFLEQAGGDPLRAAHLRKAHYAQMALKSAQARRRAREAVEAAQELAQAADAVEAEFRALGGPDAAA